MQYEELLNRWKGVAKDRRAIAYPCTCGGSRGHFVPSASLTFARTPPLHRPLGACGGLLEGRGPRPVPRQPTHQRPIALIIGGEEPVAINIGNKAGGGEGGGGAGEAVIALPHAPSGHGGTREREEVSLKGEGGAKRQVDKHSNRPECLPPRADSAARSLAGCSCSCRAAASRLFAMSLRRKRETGPPGVQGTRGSLMAHWRNLFGLKDAVRGPSEGPGAGEALAHAEPEAYGTGDGTSSTADAPPEHVALDLASAARTIPPAPQQLDAEYPEATAPAPGPAADGAKPVESPSRGRRAGGLDKSELRTDVFPAKFERLPYQGERFTLEVEGHKLCVQSVPLPRRYCSSPLAL